MRSRILLLIKGAAVAPCKVCDYVHTDEYGDLFPGRHIFIKILRR